VVLFRFPGLLAALAGGALLFSLAGASFPLFMSATSSDAVRQEISTGVVTRYGAGIAYIAFDQPLDAKTPDGAGLRERQDRLFTERVSTTPYLGPTIRSVLGAGVAVSLAGERTTSRDGWLFGRDGAAADVEILSGKEGPGVWVPDSIAEPIGVGSGDRVVLNYVPGRPGIEVTVDGVYRSLYSEPRSGAWRAWSRQIYPQCATCPAPPQFVLGDVDQVLKMTRALDAHTATFGWEAPVAEEEGLTLGQARELEAFTQRFLSDMSDQSSGYYQVFRCCGGQGGRTGTYVEFTSHISRVVSEVDRRVNSIAGPAQLLLAAGLIVAAVVVAGAGAFTLAARRVEAMYLFARGWSPLAMGVKGSLEALVPSAIGSASGLGLALVLVKLFGPGGPVAEEAIRTGSAAAIVAVPVSTLLVGGVSAFSFFRQSELHRSRLGVPARIPWELLLLGLALWLLHRLQMGGAFIQVPELDVERPSASLLLFPILLLAGASIVTARLFRLTLGWLRPRTGGLSHSVYLAANRLAGGSKIAVLLFAAAALCLGVFVHAQTVAGSLATTMEAKAKLFVGSDVAARVDADYPLPGDFPMPITKVTRIRQGGRFLQQGRRFDLLAIHPDTLVSTAFWAEPFSDRTLEDLTGLLEAEGGGRLPIIVSGANVPNQADLEISLRRIPVRVVAETATFPGTFSHDPLVVVDAAALERAYGSGAVFRISNSTTELWVRGDERRGLDALARLGLPPYSVVTASDVRDIPSFSAVINTFAMLNVLGLGAGVLVVVILLMYLQVRQRARVVSYALSLRMGLRDRSYRRSLVLELGAMLVSAFLVGLGMAFVASLLIVPLLDPLGTIPPPPLLVSPVVVLVAALVALLGVSWFGGWLTNWRARKANLAEVMRLAD